MEFWNSLEMVIQFKADADGVRSLRYLAMINTVRYLQGDLLLSLSPPEPDPPPLSEVTLYNNETT